MKYLPAVEDSYRDYLLEVPLDLQNSTDEKVKVWSNVIRYSLQDYARVLAILATSKSLDDFVVHSGGDFDNLAPVIKIAVSKMFVSITEDGKIINHIDISSYDKYADNTNDSLLPNAAYNQFPCDSASSHYRSWYILERYPYIQDLRIGFIGDDDFISTRMANHPAVDAIVVEKDERIIATINSRKQQGMRILVTNHDVCDVIQDADIDTFVTDPPYTFDGALAFIVCGLSMMGSQSGKEFYIILNPTMMGKRWHKLTATLARYGIIITGVEKNVSNYRLPDNFGERERADKFLQSLNIKPSALKYSSNSTMYTFLATQNVDIDDLRSVINYDTIYEHYS